MTVAATLTAPSQIYQCFRGHPKTEPKNHRFVDAFWAHFRLPLASFLAKFWDDFPLQFFDLFSMRLFLILAAFLITPTFHFGALAYTPCDFSSFRQVAKSTNTTPKYLPNYLQNPPKINQQIIKKSIKKCIRFWIGFYLQNGAKMIPQWEGKNWENLTLGPWDDQGRPQGLSNAATGPPKPPKWSPRVPQSLQNGAQTTPKPPKRYPSDLQSTQNSPRGPQDSLVEARSGPREAQETPKRGLEGPPEAGKRRQYTGRQDRRTQDNSKRFNKLSKGLSKPLRPRPLNPVSTCFSCI